LPSAYVVSAEAASALRARLRYVSYVKLFRVAEPALPARFRADGELRAHRRPGLSTKARIRHCAVASLLGRVRGDIVEVDFVLGHDLVGNDATGTGRNRASPGNGQAASRGSAAWLRRA
jgi:hypothetical protein